MTDLSEERERREHRRRVEESLGERSGTARRQSEALQEQTQALQKQSEVLRKQRAEQEDRNFHAHNDQVRKRGHQIFEWLILSVNMGLHTVIDKIVQRHLGCTVDELRADEKLFHRRVEIVYLALEDEFVPAVHRRRQELEELGRWLNPREYPVFEPFTISCLINGQFEAIKVITGTGNNFKELAEALTRAGGNGLRINIHALWEKIQLSLDQRFPNERETWRKEMAARYLTLRMAGILEDTVPKWRYRVFGINRESKSDLVMEFVAASAGNARQKAELAGLVVGDVVQLSDSPVLGEADEEFIRAWNALSLDEQKDAIAKGVTPPNDLTKK
jgi:hypothetical protein